MACIFTDGRGHATALRPGASASSPPILIGRFGRPLYGGVAGQTPDLLGSPGTRSSLGGRHLDNRDRPTGASAADQGVRPTISYGWPPAKALACRSPELFGRQLLLRVAMTRGTERGGTCRSGSPQN